MTILTEDGSIKDPFRNFIALSRYARWREEDARRETWAETVQRFGDFWRRHLVQFGMDPRDPIFTEVETAILNHEVMPSMRALMTAGPALERSHIAGYNCSYISVDHRRAFDEAMYILLNGTGVGFSVETKHVENLPEVPTYTLSGGLNPTLSVVVVEDSKEGWAESFHDVISMLYAGIIPTWDLSKVRPAGERLKTFGGRASGPGPLDQLFQFAVALFLRAQGRKLTPLEAHDLMCMIGEVVVVGGVRRSALISLSDLGDHDMAVAKSGSWWETHPERRIANNSAVYYSKPSPERFLREWSALIESQSGERGIINMDGLRKHVNAQGRDGSRIEGLNPCAEIALRDMEFCNLSEVVIRPGDTSLTLRRKVTIAAVIGTWQSTLTDFNHIRPEWKMNCEEERLLGVSLTGIYGHPSFNDPFDSYLPERLEKLRACAHAANEFWSERLGIRPAAAITCVKPSGTVSSLTGVSSGIHPWHAAHYVRTVRGSHNDPMSQFMTDQGLPFEPDVMKPKDTDVFSFPMKAPKGAVTRDQVSALEHLRLWSIYRQHWTDHNPSVTINVRPEEWVEVGAWVYANWDLVGGISFLPYSEHTYKQAPFQEVSEAEYEALSAEMPESIAWDELSFYEFEDATTGSHELACSAGGCDVVDMVSA